MRAPALTLGTRILLELLLKVLNPSGSISVHGGVVGHGSTRLANEGAYVAVRQRQDVSVEVHVMVRDELLEVNIQKQCKHVVLNYFDSFCLLGLLVRSSLVIDRSTTASANYDVHLIPLAPELLPITPLSSEVGRVSMVKPTVWLSFSSCFVGDGEDHSVGGNV